MEHFILVQIILGSIGAQLHHVAPFNAGSNAELTQQSMSIQKVQHLLEWLQ